MSNSNLTNTFIVREDAAGQIPDPPATFQRLRVNSSRLRLIKKSEKSQQIRTTRGTAQMPVTAFQTEGSIDTEFAVGPFNELILAALQCSEWTEGTFTMTGDIDAETGVFTVTAGLVPSDAQKARYMKISGASTGNSGIKRVVSASVSEIVFEGMVDDETGVGVTILWRYARNGREFFTFTIENEYLDTEPTTFIAYSGTGVDTWTVNATGQAVIAQEFSFMGLKAAIGTATFGDGTPTDDQGQPICTGFNVSRVHFGDDALGVVNTLAFTLSNNLRQRPVVASLYNLVQGTGRSIIEGQITAYFESAALLSAFLNHERKSVLIPFVDDEGSTLSVYLPVTRSPAADNTIAGENSDVFQTYSFMALEDLTNSYVVQIDYLSGTEVVNADNGFENFEGYANLSLLNGQNGGINFNAGWISGQFDIGVRASDDFEQSSTGNLNGANGGEVFSGAWIDGAQALGVQVHYNFADNTVGDLDGQGGGSGASLGPWIDGVFYTGIKAFHNFENGIDGGSVNGLGGGDGWLTEWID